SHGALVDAARALDIGAGSELLDIDEGVIGFVRIVEGGKAVGVVSPWEAAAVDNGATERRAVTAEEFRQRMHGNIGAVIERFQQDWRRNGVVDHQWHAMTVRNLRQRLD